MAVAVNLSRRNVVERTGGPFGAVVVDLATRAIVAAGVNLVVASNNSVLHAEIVALMFAEARLRRFAMGAVEGPGYSLVSSCDPCAMCLGAALWSGVTRLVCGASGTDARAAGFDEGPVFDESFTYLERRGISIVRGVARDEARRVFDEYLAAGGPIYNPRREP